MKNLLIITYNFNFREKMAKLKIKLLYHMFCMSVIRNYDNDKVKNIYLCNVFVILFYVKMSPLFKVKTVTLFTVLQIKWNVINFIIR